MSEYGTRRRVLAFDIGIKNLAWCVVEKDLESKTFRILGWDNYNLLEEESAEAVAVPCGMCKAKAIYTCNRAGEETLPRCGRHVPPTFTVFKDAKGKPAKKLPPVATLKKLVKELPRPVGVASGGKAPPVPAGKDALVDALRHCYAIPIVQKKVSKAADAGLVLLHDSIRRLAEYQQELWCSCDLIGLENQPAFKNPTMKSVQMLLFATLRDMYQPHPPELKLIHAKKKVEGAEKGDKGYKERKAGSEHRAAQFLHGSGVGPAEQVPANGATRCELVGGTPWLKIWNAAKKKSDLADALAMCLDQLG
jgi:hypothetical protein